MGTVSTQQTAAFIKFFGSSLTHAEVESRLRSNVENGYVAALTKSYGIGRAEATALVNADGALSRSDVGGGTTFSEQDVAAWLQTPFGQRFWTDYKAALESGAAVPKSPLPDMMATYLQAHGSTLSHQEIVNKLTDAKGRIDDVDHWTTMRRFGLTEKQAKVATGEGQRDLWETRYEGMFWWAGYVEHPKLSVRDLYRWLNTDSGAGHWDRHRGLVNTVAPAAPCTPVGVGFGSPMI